MIEAEKFPKQIGILQRKVASWSIYFCYGASSGFQASLIFSSLIVTITLATSFIFPADSRLGPIEEMLVYSLSTSLMLLESLSIGAFLPIIITLIVVNVNKKNVDNSPKRVLILSNILIALCVYFGITIFTIIFFAVIAYIIAFLS